MGAGGKHPYPLLSQHCAGNALTGAKELLPNSCWVNPPTRGFLPHPVSAASADTITSGILWPQSSLHPEQKTGGAFTWGLTRTRIWGLDLLPLGGAWIETLWLLLLGDLLPVCKTSPGLPGAAGAITWSQTLLGMGTQGLGLPQCGHRPPSSAQGGADSRHRAPPRRVAILYPEPQLNGAPAPEGL